MPRPPGMQEKMVKPAGIHLPVVSSLAPPDVAGNEIQFNSFDNGCALVRQRAAQLGAAVSWPLKSISVSDRLEKHLFCQMGLCVLSESGFLADFNAGEVATLVVLFRLFYSILGRRVSKRKRSESKPPLF